MSERKRKTSPIDGQPHEKKKNGFEERKHGEIWKFILRHIRNAEDLTLDPPMSEKIREGMMIWEQMKEEVDTILEATDLYDMFHNAMVPNLAFADLSIQTKACLYYALQKPVDSEFQNQLHDVADYRLDDHNVLIAFRKKSPEEITIKDDPNDPWYEVWPDRNAENNSVEKHEKKNPVPIEKCTEQNPEEDSVFIVNDVDNSVEQQNFLIEQFVEKNPENSAVNNQEQQNFFTEKSAEKNPEQEHVITEKDAETEKRLDLSFDEITFTEESCWGVAEGGQSGEAMDVDAMTAFIRESFQSTSAPIATNAAFPLIDITDSDFEAMELAPRPVKTIEDALLKIIAPADDLTQQIVDDEADDDDVQEVEQVTNDADDDEIVFIGTQPGTDRRSSFKKEGNTSFREETTMNTPKTTPIYSSPLGSTRSRNARNQMQVHSNAQFDAAATALDSPMHVSNTSFIEETTMNTPTTTPIYSSPLDSTRSLNARNQMQMHSNVQFDAAATALDSPMDVRPPNVREHVLNLERCLGDAQIKAAQDALRITDLETKLQKFGEEVKILQEDFITSQLRISILESQNKEVNQRFDRVERELQLIRSKELPPSLEFSTSSTSAFFTCSSESFVVSPIKIPQAVSLTQETGPSDTRTPNYPIDDETPPIIRPKRIVPKGKPADAYEDKTKKTTPKKKTTSKLTSRKGRRTPNKTTEKENDEEEKTPAPAAIPKKRTEVSKLHGILGANDETPTSRRNTKTPIRFGV
ncbi:hypothetical protein CAEBREN_08207 [Caenorhabditis brenneri]|uniref:SPK domain-containing protein n=1 Tax=Caenorhabditis brenneri TaxID=135651 RepID=G0NJ35_CAEBE|nr:hypothetical protein CAEBREN_08207 [Caenorhabditis brenneri]